MARDRIFAFRVVFERAGERGESVVPAPDLVQAAEQVRSKLGPVDRIIEIRSMAEVMPEQGLPPAPRPPVLATPEPTRPQPPAPQPVVAPRPRLALRQGGTRQAQLLSVLEEVGGPVHLDVIAEALGINRAYADNVALRGVRAGLVVREGVGSGLVRLADEGTVGQPVIRRRRGRGGRPSRLDQLLHLLRSHDGPLHMDDIVGTLELTRTHADNIVADGSRYGLLRRLDDRSGRVELVQQAAT